MVTPLPALYTFSLSPLRWGTPPLFLLGLLLSFTTPVFAQEGDTLSATLPSLVIEASRAAETAATAPFSVSITTRRQAAVTLEPGIGLSTVLQDIPGLYLSDRGHFALGDRVSVRGLGSRSAFGVRGVQVLLNGIPLTLPDGQAVLDIVDPAFLRRTELVRGPTSHFWGNASGGTLFLSTEAPTGTPRVRLRALAGGDALRQGAVETYFGRTDRSLHLFASDVRRDGFRDHSQGRFTRAGLSATYAVTPQTRVRLVGALADQEVEHPGALTATELAANRQGADARFVASKAGKESLQVQGGARIDHTVSAGMFSASVYGLSRSLDNPLPFAYIGLDRTTGGFRLAFHRDQTALHWGAGVDAGLQRDDRHNWNTDNGRPGDERLLDQLEKVRNAAVFGYLSVPLPATLRLTLSLRADHLRFTMTDRLLDNGDDTGERSFAALSPGVGLAYRHKALLFFANYSTAFETPTTTELVNRPDLSGGFNPDLDPQHIRGLEAGVRGVLPGTPLFLDLTLFHLDVKDRLVSFETETGGGRTFYRNSGRNTHDGIEAALSWPLPAGLVFDVTYTGSRFVFKDEPLNGNRLPGLPNHRLYAGLQWQHSGLWARVIGEALDGQYTNDENTARNDGSFVLDAFVGHTGIPIGAARLQPFAHLANALDRRYNGSVSVNAFGGRSFEPAPGRRFTVGLNLTFP